MLIEKGSKLVMIGDSITDCGRTQPVGEGLFGAEGNGYVNLVNAIIKSTYPEKKIRVVNMGTSGNTVRDLKARWEKDVTAQKPDWLSIMIGINDVWRHFDLPTQKEIHVDIDEYRSTLEELVKVTRPQLKGLVLMTPYFIEPNLDEPMRKMMDTYGKEVKSIAQKYDAVFVDTQAAFDEILKHTHPMELAWDRVHPNTAGHMVIARTLLNSLE